MFHCRGIPLPERGSWQDKLMVEVLHREREVQLAMWESTIMAMGMLLGSPVAGNVNMTLVLKRELRKFVNHDTFSSEQALHNVRAKLTDLERDRQMMRRLEEL